MGFLDYIMRFLGIILSFLQSLVGNYGITIILFTVLIKLVLFPLTLKQQRSTAHMQQIQPLLAEVQRKYANDKDKLNQETLKLYSKYNINPMSGCWPMLIQLPIIIALYWVVRKPLTYVMGIGYNEVWQIAEAFNAWAAANLDKVPEAIQHLTYGKSMADNIYGSNEIQIAQVINQYYDDMLANSDFVALAGSTLDKIKQINFYFLGLDLADSPSFGALINLCMGKTEGLTKSTILLWLVPLLSGVTSYVSSKVTMVEQEKHKTPAQKLQEAEKPNTANTMMKIMPLFSAWITFSLPAAVGFYWIVSNLLTLIQQLYFNKFINPKINNETIEAEMIADVKKSRKKRKKSK